ncbi:MAG: hypothetical protein WGN25_10015 [Candidatus Electrothrix sp. GW3-4]|uniref:hypothetical protein n=1 Tax=Candidatus Electrothrix sp. GW3-4 TaxID=3126740 RepID=UPI0030CE95E3
MNNTQFMWCSGFWSKAFEMYANRQRAAIGEERRESEIIPIKSPSPPPVLGLNLRYGASVPRSRYPLSGGTVVTGLVT